jgi:hypothetical protein
MLRRTEERYPMTDLLSRPDAAPAELPDDTADLVRRHKESLFPSVGLKYSEPIDSRRGEGPNG